MEKLNLKTPNFTNENIKKIAELFPNCVTEKKSENGELERSIDFDALRQELSDSIVEGSQERYSLNWPGKREALVKGNTPISKTLRPCREESIDFDSTKNIFIEGDNLDALKLLQETYLSKVKMIYIDPPYNTGKDFIYNDNFTADKEKYDEASGQRDEDGGRLVANPDSNGRFHSDWLSMIYPRLRLARNLLREDGAIFISVDNEQANMKRLCDEVFGEDNFVECISWNKRIPKNDKGIGNIHEYVLLYVKNRDSKLEFTMRKDGLDDIYNLLEKLERKKISLDQSENEIKKLYKKNGYDRGITLYNSLDKSYKLWGKINMSWPNADTFGPTYDVFHPKTGSVVKVPDRGWRWKKETFDAAAKYENGKYQEIQELHDGSYLCGKIWFAPDENTQPSSVTYLDDVNNFLLRSILSLKSDGGVEVENLFEGKSYFSYPKPTSLLRVLFSSAMAENGIFFDFFSGSGTTAHAVMQLNAEDGGNRSCISVQLPEKVNEKSEAFKAGYKNISEISKERIRRAGKKIKEDNEGKEGIENLDTGFRVFKIDSTNMVDVHVSPDDASPDMFDAHIGNIKKGRSSEDLLFQVLLDWGVDLSLPIIREEIAGKEVFFVDGNALVACFDDGINEEFVTELATRKPLRVVFRDDGFGSGKDGDSVKINVEQVFKLKSPATDIKVI